MDEFFWVKFRINDRAHTGDWEYQEFHSSYEDIDIEEYLKDLAQQKYYGVEYGYRGFEWERIDAPPAKELHRIVTSEEKELIVLTARLDRHFLLLQEALKRKED